MDVCRPQSGVGSEQGANGVDQRVVGDVLADELTGPDELLGVRRQKAKRDGVAAPVAPAPAVGPEEIPSLWRMAEQKVEGGRKMGARQGEPEAELLGGMRDVEPRQHLAEGGQRDVWDLPERVDSRAGQAMGDPEFSGQRLELLLRGVNEQAGLH